MINKKITVALLVVVFSITINSVYAQTVQRFPGVVDKPIPENKIPQSHSLETEPSKQLEEPPVKSSKSRHGKAIANLKRVIFSGNTVIDDKTLQKVVLQYIGKPLLEETLNSIKYEVKKAFYDKGYILVRVVTPKQNFASGNLKLEIYEAKVGEIKIDNKSIIRPQIASAMAARVKSGDVIREDQIETMISDLNGLNNVKAKLNLSPGKALSTTDLGISLSEAKEDVHNVSINNYGSELTGKVVAATHLEHGNLFKLGEQLSLDLQRSEDDLWNAGLGLVTPIGFKNINLETNYSHSENEIGGRLANLRASGETDLFNVALSSNLLNTRSNLATIRAGFESRVHESFLNGITDTKDNLRKAYSDASYLYRGNDKVFYGSAKVSRGVDVLGASEKGEAVTTRRTGNQEAWMFEPTLLANLRPLSEDGTVKMLVRGQMASQNLLSSDLFALGGYGSVRGFPVAEGAAEEGYSFTAQYDHVLPVHIEKVTFKAGPFIDGGALYNRIDGTVTDNHFYSTGLGLEAATKIVPVGDTLLKLDWAHPVGSYRSTRISDDTFYFNLKQDF